MSRYAPDIAVGGAWDEKQNANSSCIRGPWACGNYGGRRTLRCGIKAATLKLKLPNSATQMAKETFFSKIAGESAKEKLGTWLPGGSHEDS